MNQELLNLILEVSAAVIILLSSFAYFKIMTTHKTKNIGKQIKGGFQHCKVA